MKTLLVVVGLAYGLYNLAPMPTAFGKSFDRINNALTGK